jgi:hypothetical protein
MMPRRAEPTGEPGKLYGLTYDFDPSPWLPIALLSVNTEHKSGWVPGI